MGITGQDFQMWQGEDEVIEVPITDGESPVNLTGATVTWKLSQSGVTVLTKTTSDDITIGAGDAVGDLVTIAVRKANTATLSPGYYTHECRVVSGGDEQVVFTGTMRLIESLTL